MPTADTISKQRERKWAWIWIVYTGFMFIDPVLEPSRALWLGTFGVFFLFLGIMWCYLRFSGECHPLRYWMIAATFLLGLFTFPWNQGGSCLFAYAAAFIPFCVISVRRVLALQAGILVSIYIEGYLCHARHGAFHISWPNTYIAIFIAVIVGGGNIFFAEQKRADRKLHEAQEENIALAAVAERERIARDLHDVLGHTLSVITLKAELAGRLVQADPARAVAEIADVERLARASLAEVREAITGYRAQGLGAEIEAARRTLDAAGVSLLLDGSSTRTATLTPQEETTLALALREAVTNIVRHARATTCSLRFHAENGTRRLIVEDNGATATIREGNGLRGMRERIESLGGQLALEHDHGTRLLITLPAGG